MSERVFGKIIKHDEQGATIFVPASKYNLDWAVEQQYKDAEIILHDGRRLSGKQRRLIYSLMGAIQEYSQISLQSAKDYTKLKFIADDVTGLFQHMFSLSDCDMTTALHFSRFLLDFVLDHNIPVKFDLLEFCQHDIENYVHACLKYRKCAVCGKDNAFLHHVSAVGMGRDRTEIVHIGMLVVSLCWEHHSKVHTTGNSWLTEELHIKPIPLTMEIGKIYGLKKKNLEVASN